MIDEYILVHNNVLAVGSLGKEKYLNILRYHTMVLGNLSGNIWETPSFDVLTINVEDRLRGRVATETVIDCEPQKEKMWK